jgi:hypothetical protein
MCVQTGSEDLSRLREENAAQNAEIISLGDALEAAQAQTTSMAGQLDDVRQEVLQLTELLSGRCCMLDPHCRAPLQHCIVPLVPNSAGAYMHNAYKAVHFSGRNA